MEKLHKYEMETITNFTEDVNDIAEICTFNQKVQKRLAKLAAEHPEEVRLHPRQYTDGSVRYIVPQRWLVNALATMGPRAGRPMTEKQREALAKGREMAAKKAQS